MVAKEKKDIEKELKEKKEMTIIRIKSIEKQEEKLFDRINNLDKHWKHSDQDWETRKNWNKFMKSY